MKALYTGDRQLEDGSVVTGEGLADYLVFLESADLATRIENEFDAALQAVDAVTLPLGQAVLNEPEQVQALYDALRALIISTKVDMTNVMGVTITFNDNDGD